MLESAIFYLKPVENSFQFDFNGYVDYVNGLKNLTQHQKDEAFFKWIEAFPNILKILLENQDFIRINDEIQNRLDANLENYIIELSNAEKILGDLYYKSGLDFKPVTVILSPLKCAYSSDYMLNSDSMIVTLGKFRLDSIVHESLHFVVNSYILKRKEEILHSWNYCKEDIDKSYFLDNDENGVLNAFEELIVRKISGLVCKMKSNIDIDSFINKEILN